MNVAAWLRELGLERYEPAFRDNEIDAAVLPELTDEHLKELGLPLGPRLKLLKAIAALRDGGQPAGDGAAPALGRGARTGPAVSAAERRQLTVLFCDLVGSTELSARLDPEDLRGIIGAYHRRCAEVVERYDGHIAKFLGDGVLAYFGYPRAHEDDAERAARAGLDLVGAVGRLRPRPNLTLRVRVGIATGLVVVGDLIGEGAAREQAVVGETPNLAARLQALAEPDSVVIAPGTRRLVAGLFDLADLGARDLKGFARPVRAWRVLGAGRAASRFEARQQAAGMTPLVGRKHELALLLDRWHLAKEGEGQVVLLSGEPGIGKSRLTEGLRERLDAEPHTPLRYQCSPYHTNSTLHPVIDQLERAAGLGRDDPPGRKLDKLEAVLALAAEDVQAVAPLLADLLAIPTGDRYPPLDLTPQRRKELTLEALVAHLAGLARREPVLAVFEDAHWIDPTSLELLERLVDRMQSLPALLVVTFRPEFTPPSWAGRHPHVTALSLSRLSRRRAVRMVERITGGGALPREVLNQILAKTDGVPLFVEELTKTVLESGLLRDEGARFELAGPLPPLAIPSTLHESLMARLDRLAPVKEVAQIAACIGREFSHELLAAVAPLPEAKLRDALDQLVRAELVFRRGTPPGAVYAFKHALVQDAAYGTLLRGLRQQLHARIARVLEERFPETTETQPEVLARHFAEAGQMARASTHLLEAGRRAAQRSANLEAITHLTKGIQALGGLPDTPERVRQELALQLALGPALLATRGWNAPEADGAYRRAQDLAQRLGDDRERFQAVWGLWFLQNARSTHAGARDLVAELFRIASRLDDAALRLQAHHAAWATSAMSGDPAAASKHAMQGLALYNPEEHRAHIFLYGGHDTAACAKGMGAMMQWLLGYPDQAARTAHEAVVLAESLAHPPSLAHAVLFAMLCHRFRRDVASVLECSERLLSLAAEHGLAQYHAMGSIGRGWALAYRGQADEGLAELRRGLDALVTVGVKSLYGCFHAALAESYGRIGETGLGLAAIKDALCIVDQTSERFWRAGMLHTRGELLASASQPTEAEECYLEARAVAQEQTAKSLELRATTSLARLWRDQGKRAEACELLAPIYGGFTEGLDTPDLKDAKVLLDELS